MKLKKIYIALTLIIIVTLCTSLIIKLPAKEKTNNKEELVQKLTVLFDSLSCQGYLEYLGNDNSFSPLGNNSCDTNFSIKLNHFLDNDFYKGFDINIALKKDLDSKQISTVIDAGYRGIPLISLRSHIDNSTLKLAVPKLFSSILKADTQNLSQSVSNSMLGVFIDNSIDLSFLDLLSPESLFSEDNNLTLENFLSYIISDFSSIYPEASKIIAKNILVTKDASNYILTIKPAALKLLLKDFSKYVFESTIFQRIFSYYIDDKYNSDPNISEFYTQNEYKEEYLKHAKESVTSITSLIADLINFDIDISFILDNTGNISEISYSHSNENIEAKAAFAFTPLNNPADINGEIYLSILDNDYRLTLKRNNIINENNILVNTNITGTENNNKLFSLDLITDYTKKDYLSDTYFEINFESFMNSNELLSFLITYDSDPLNSKITSLSGKKEIDIFDIEIHEITSLISEIKENINSLKGLIH